jgi:DNA-binding PadR family transcriptional regulator
MAGTETRLLVLGAVALFEPVNGYQIRRELLSWQVDRWAHVNPGSIYSSLSTLAKQGFLQRHAVREGAREVAVYTLTEAGHTELGDLFGRALETVELVDALPVQTALSMCSLFDRAVVAGHLAVRVDALVAHLAQLRVMVQEAGEASPPHVARVAQLRVATAEAELDWLRDLLAEVRSGGLAFAGEPLDWTPPADDPGWQMAADRERYRRLLDGR